MKLSEKIAAALLVSTLMISLSACDDGPLEEAGEEIDDKAEDAGNAIEDAADGD